MTMVAQYMIKSGYQIKIAHKYNDEHDMWIIFDHSGANHLVSFSEWRLAANHEEQVSSDLQRSSALMQNYLSDWIGPYVMRANHNGNDHHRSFTGGNHAYDGGATGSPTARTESVEVWVDGQIAPDDQVIANHKVTIRVINYIQGYNTKSLEGYGREILKETVTYELKSGEVQVHVELQALEEITITTYYGLQTVNKVWNDKVRYLVDDQAVAHGPARGQYSDSGVRTEQPNVNRFLIQSDEYLGSRHQLHAWIDRQYGLGQLPHLADHMPIVFTQDYGKSYFLLIKETAPIIEQGEILTWRGGYHFMNCGKTDF